MNENVLSRKNQETFKSGKRGGSGHQLKMERRKREGCLPGKEICYSWETHRRMPPFSKVLLERKGINGYMDLISAPGRKYPVSAPSDSFSISGESVQLKEIAHIYAPVLFLHPAIDYMRPVRLLYEAFSSGRFIFLNYYVHWKDEIHPNRLFHIFYRGFRSVVYGSPDDIEYIQVAVDTTAGTVGRIVFETDPAGRPDSNLYANPLGQDLQPRGTAPIPRWFFP